MFCGKCGKQAGTAPPPKPKRFCQGCGSELIDGLKFCQSCGYQVPGMGFSMPSGGSLNIQAASSLVSGVSGKLGLSLQKMVIAVACVLGVIACFLPFFRSSAMGITVTANAFSISGGALGALTGGNVMNILGIPAVIFFGIMLVMCFIGDRAAPLGKRKTVFIIFGILNVIVGIINFAVFGGGTYKVMSNIAGGGVGFGLYMMILMSVAIVVVPFVKKLEN
ncbi:MAG: zinc ribbon domain-containing protein [Oscillospiraceae bacterium]|nr:zinc ribbon domain-containing protein [Oscillospiraceae bacterium]